MVRLIWSAALRSWRYLRCVTWFERLGVGAVVANLSTSIPVPLSHLINFQSLMCRMIIWKAEWQVLTCGSSQGFPSEPVFVSPPLAALHIRSTLSSGKVFGTFWASQVPIWCFTPWRRLFASPVFLIIFVEYHFSTW